VKDWATGSASTNNTTSSSSSSVSRTSRGGVRQAPWGQTYAADPLNLSPLHQLPYLFVADARRMLSDTTSEGGAQVGVGVGVPR